MQIDHIDTRQLRYFVAVAEALSFSRAAERLNMSQPPLSLAVKALEEQLETKLFNRTKRQVELTSAGTYLLRAARPVLRQMHDALIYTQAAGRGDIGELRLSVNFSTLMNPEFDALMAAFRKAHPNVRITITETVYADAIKSLAARQSDLCFVWPHSTASDGNINYQVFHRAPMRLCLSASNPLAKKKKLGTADLKGVNILMSPRQGAMRLFRNLQANAHKAGFMLTIEQDAVIFPVVASLVAADYGVAYLPDYFAHQGRGRIICRDLSDIKPADCMQTIAIAYPANSDNILVRQFLDLARKMA